MNVLTRQRHRRGRGRPDGSSASTPHRRGRHAVVRAAAVGLGGLLLVLAAPAAPASAHATLLSSDPPAGAVLSAAPAEVVLTFSEPVRLVPDRVLVVAPDGSRADRGEPRVDGAVVTIPLGESSARGTYLASYRVISADSHPVAGGVTYSVGAPSQEPPELTDSDVEDPVVAAASSVVKYLGYAGLVLLVGPALMLARLWPRRLAHRGVVRLVWSGVGLVTLSTLAGLWVQAPYTTGGSLFGVDGAGLREVLGSTYGQAHLVRLGVLVAVALLLRPVLAGRAGRADLALLGVVGAVGLGTWPVAGHPIASPVPAVSIVADVIHLAAAAFWIGGLVVLAGFLLRRANERELGAILPVWSQYAALAVAALLVAGLTQALLEVGTPQALVSTGYGRLLLVKVGLVGVVITVAGYSRRLVRRRLSTTRPAALRTAVAIEAGVLAGVLALSSVLVQTTPARTEVAAAEQSTTSDVSTILDSPLYSLQVLLEPGERGTNTLHLYAYTPAGEPQPVVEWGATASLPAAEVAPIDIPLQVVADNHALADVELPLAGEWELRFTLRTSEIDQASVSVEVPIEEEAQ